jgi:membrane dipeptidase
MDWSRLETWHLAPQSFGDADYRQLADTGVQIFHPAVDTGTRNHREVALRWLGRWNQLLVAKPCRLGRVDSVADLDRLPGSDRIGVVLGFQNSEHFESFEDVRQFFSLGQRVSQLTYNTHNALGSGCWEHLDRGLTRYGGDIVGEMNRIGMAIDLSHCGERTSLDAIEASTAPVLVTHSNCRTLVPYQPRAKSDLVIRRLAAKGGVIGITLVRGFVGAGQPSIEDVLDHFDRVARLVGIEYVGLGTDISSDDLDPSAAHNPAVFRIRGVDPRLRVFQLAEGLLRRRYDERSIRLVLGGNFRRVLGDIWPSPAPSEAGRTERRDPFCRLPRPSRR